MTADSNEKPLVPCGGLISIERPDVSGVWQNIMVGMNSEGPTADDSGGLSTANPWAEETNIGVVDDQSNLGPVFGDLAGSVVAEPLKNAIGFRHFWVTTSGDTINFKDALLQADKSASLDDGNLVVVRWGHYRSEIDGGAGKFQDATGYLDYFGLADFNAKTLVLRYRCEINFAH